MRKKFLRNAGKQEKSKEGLRGLPAFMLSLEIGASA
jgi:hypothetical protein